MMELVITNLHLMVAVMTVTMVMTVIMISAAMDITIG